MTRIYAIGAMVCLLLQTPRAFANEEHPFPEGCGNPFVADGVFSDFFEKTIQSSVIESGAVSKAHVQLFAVNRLRKYAAEKYPNPAEGELVDKHVRAQLCSYGRDKKNLNSSSIELHRHLATISGRMLGDVKKVVGELDAKERQRQKSVAKFEARYALVERAERLAESEVANFVK